jgi:hypothetical protein
MHVDLFEVVSGMGTDSLLYMRIASFSRFVSRFCGYELLEYQNWGEIKIRCGREYLVLYVVNWVILNARHIIGWK